MYHQGLGLSILHPASALELDANAAAATEEAPTVELGLEYDPDPYARLPWALPAWLLLAAGVYVVAQYAGARI